MGILNPQIFQQDIRLISGISSNLAWWQTFRWKFRDRKYWSLKQEKFTIHGRKKITIGFEGDSQDEVESRWQNLRKLSFSENLRNLLQQLRINFMMAWWFLQLVRTEYWSQLVTDVVAHNSKISEEKIWFVEVKFLDKKFWLYIRIFFKINEWELLLKLLCNKKRKEKSKKKLTISFWKRYCSLFGFRL